MRRDTWPRIGAVIFVYDTLSSAKRRAAAGLIDARLGQIDRGVGSRHLLRSRLGGDHATLRDADRRLRSGGVGGGVQQARFRLFDVGLRLIEGGLSRFQFRRRGGAAAELAGSIQLLLGQLQAASGGDDIGLRLFDARRRRKRSVGRLPQAAAPA